MTDKLVYALAAAAANLLGALLVTWRTRWSAHALDAMLAFAAGFMIAVALIDLFPEALARGGHSAAVVALGAYLAVHVTQHVIGTHFHFGELDGERPGRGVQPRLGRDVGKATVPWQDRHGGAAREQ